MNLKVEGRRTIDNDGLYEIVSSVALVGRSGNSFLILSRNEMSYIQIASADPNHYVAEYQEDGTSQHYQSLRSDLDQEQVCCLLGSYFQGNDSWKSLVEWKRVNVGNGPTVVGDVSLILVILAFATLLVFAWVGMFSESRRPFGLSVVDEVSISVGILSPAIFMQILRDWSSWNSFSMRSRFQMIGSLLALVAFLTYWIVRLLPV